MKNKLKRLESIRNEINILYAEKQVLDKDVIQYFIDNKDKFSELELDDYIVSLKWIYEKEIDYEKLEEMYPEIYILGLLPTFSKKQLLKVVDKEQARLILKECTYDTSHYKMVMKRKRKKYRKKVIVDE